MVEKIHLEPRRYYWLCSYPLQAGSIVAPGNWGRMLMQYNQSSNMANVAREYIFEKVRLEHFSDKPSRLSSTFLCNSETAARTFQKETGRVFDILFEIEIQGDGLIFASDWKLTNFPQVFTIQDIENNVKTYWGGRTDNETVEIFTLNNIKIIRRI